MMVRRALLRANWPLIPILWGAFALKAALLALDAVPFNSDEAIVALMARHILRGERPWFFYGQAYMGSLDAYLVAAAFRLLGERVWTIRAVQTALFLLWLASGYPVARSFSGDRRVATWTVFLLAFPPVLLTLYTTATLGGYGEALLAGNFLLWWGGRLSSAEGGRPTLAGRRDSALWLAWGFTAGLGFWALGLTAIYAAPVGLWLLYRGRWRAWRGYVLAALGCALGSLPWWLGNLGRLDAGAAELLGAAVRSTATASTPLGNVAFRAFNFFVFGLTVLFGLRFPWGMVGPPLWLALPVIPLYLGALARQLAPGVSKRPPFLLLWGVCGALFLGFILTPFGGDPSGRYFVPLYLPLAVFTADALVALYGRIGRWAWALAGATALFNLVGVGQAALTNPPGITTQFEAITQVDHRHDAALMDFLRAHDGRRGYGNYWVAYPIAFLSGEEIILIPRLPYKEDLRYTPRDDRYAPYTALVEASPTVVYVTTRHPALDALLRARFEQAGVSYAEAQIGDYHVFYDLSRKITPRELRLPGHE